MNNKYGKTIKFKLIESGNVQQLAIRATRHELNVLTWMNPDLKPYFYKGNKSIFEGCISFNGMSATEIKTTTTQKNSLTKKCIGNNVKYDLKEKYKKFTHKMYHLSNELPSIKNFHGSQEEVKEILSALLLNAQGLVIGEESHNNLAPKLLLGQQMQHLYNLGVRTLFLEHCCFDTIQEQLDSFFNKKSPTEFLKIFLERGCGGCVGENNYYPLVEAAVFVGIRPVGLEYSKSQDLGYTMFGSHGELRMIGLNVPGKEIIEQQAGQDKYVSLVGAAHDSYYFGIAGFSEICGVPSMVIGDAKPNEKPCYQTNLINLGGKDIEFNNPEGKNHFSHVFIRL